MNANELADEFEEYLKEIEELPWGNHQILCDQAADLLRQQQAEIEALNQRIERMIEKQSHYEAMAHAGGFEAGRAREVAKQIDNDEYITPED